MAQAEIYIDVWSDYVCPFCYLELPVVARLQTEFGAAIAVRWRAFELRPEPVPTLDPAGEYLRSTWARTVYPMAEQRGMTLRLPPVQPRSRLALEAAAHARAENRFDDMHAALFRAFFEEGRDIGRTEVLLDIAAGAGVEPMPLAQALEDGRHREAVAEDRRLARDLGIDAVPAMLLRHSPELEQAALPLAGALPYEHVARAVNHMLRDRR